MPAPLLPPVAVTVQSPLMLMLPHVAFMPEPMPAALSPPVAVTLAKSLMVMLPHDTTDPEYTAAREAEIGSVYGFSAVDKGTDHVGDFVKVGNNVWINPMRAYLKRSTTTARAMTPGAQTPQLPDKMKVVIVSASGTTTEIGTLDTRTGEISLDVWYSLDGRKLDVEPTQHGIYIYKGKKVKK